MPRFKLVIFDFDDTLVHLKVDWNDVRREALKIAIKEKIFLDPKEHLVVIGNQLSKTSSLKNELDDVYRRYEKAAVDQIGYSAIGHMAALAKELHKAGYKIGLASGNHTSNLRAILSRLGILKSFDVVCGRDSIWNNKPAPDQLVFIMQRTGIEKSEVLFIGDSKFDEEAAQAAGVVFFKVSKPPSETDVPRIRELLSS